jgi:hypothetical protein
VFGEEMTLDQMCEWKEASVSQRESELERGDSKIGTVQYEKKGCYKCDGYRTGCLAYFPKNVEKEKWFVKCVRLVMEKVIMKVTIKYVYVIVKKVRGETNE